MTAANACLITVIVAAALVTTASAQAPTTVFRGRPVIKVTESGTDRKAEPITDQLAPNLAVVVSKIGEDYYWASRENVPMVAMDAGGAYVTYVAVTGAGYVKVLKPNMKAMASLVDDAARQFDYVEHLTTGLSSITYYGVAR